MILEKGMEMILPQTGTATGNLQSCEGFHMSHTLGQACYRQVKLTPQSSGFGSGFFLETEVDVMFLWTRCLNLW